MRASRLTILVVAGLAVSSAHAAERAPLRVAEAVAEAPLADAPAAPPATQLIARVDLSEQKMYVYVENVLTYTWDVSTGRRGYGTPTGQWNAEWMAAKWRSRKYNNAPMPWSVFFYRGYAIHGTTDIRRLGQVASHGCVRLHPDNARTFYRLVEAYGKKATLVSVVR